MKMPKLMLGTSPLIGAGQFGLKSIIYYRRYYLNRKNIVDLYFSAYKLGIKAIQLIVEEPLVEALKECQIKFYLVACVHGNFEKNLRLLKDLKPEIIALHASLVDSLKLDKIKCYLNMVNETGAKAGVATHAPGRTIPVLEELNEVYVYLAPLNKLGAFMEPDFDSSLKAIEETNKKLIAIKPLAAGRLKPEEALEFVFKYADSAAVGLTSEKEVRECVSCHK